MNSYKNEITEKKDKIVMQYWRVNYHRKDIHFSNGEKKEWKKEK